MLVNNGDFFDIDLNNDGIIEGTIGLVQYSYYSAYGSNFYNRITILPDTILAEVATTSSTFYLNSSTYTVNIAKPFNLNDSVTRNNRWGNSSYPIGAYVYFSYNGPYSSFSSTFYVGQFPGAGDKYMGIRFKLNNTTHYGWVRLSVSQKSDTVTIKDFAYNATANTPILAGDTGIAVGIREGIFGKNDLYARANQIRVVGQLPAHTILKLRDLQGKVIFTKELNPNEENINIQNLSNGIFIAELTNGKQFFRKKLWLEID